jgi:hypothetical protein
VLPYYPDSKQHINFVKFFVRNASLLELMRLELPHYGNVSDDGWIRRQHKLLKIEKMASRRARFDFVFRNFDPFRPLSESEELVHDMSILVPFQRIHE